MNELSQRTHTIMAAVLVCVIGVFYLTTIREGHVWGDDQCAYIHHARNIVEGREYGDTGFIRSPTSIAPLMYPPVFPLLLVPVYRCSGAELAPMKSEVIVFFCLALYLFYVAMRRNGNQWASLWAIAVVGFCPYFWDFKDILYAEFPFLTFTYGALLAATCATDMQCSGAKRILLGAAVGVLSCLAFGTRTVGIVLIPAVVFHDVVVRRKPTWFSAASIVSFAAGTALLRLLFKTHSDYLASYLNALSVRALVASPVYYLKCFSVLWDNGYSGVPQGTLYILVSVLALYGGWVRLRTRQWCVVDVFAVFYFLLIALFPWGGRRYLMPVVPVYVFYSLLGLDTASGQHTRRRCLILRGGAVAAIVLCFMAKYTTVNWTEVPSSFDRPETRQLMNYVRDQIAPDGTVVFRKPRFMAFYSGAKAAGCYEDEDDDVLAYYRRIGVSHVVVSRVFSEEKERFLIGFIKSNAASFERTFDNADFSVYRIQVPSSTR